MKSEMLTVEEMDRAIRYLVRQVSALKPDWRLEGPEL